MKTLNSTVEGTWIEIKQVEISQEDKNLLESTSETDLEAKKVLIDKIKSERESVALESDVTLAKTTYESKKPTLKSTDTYQLISADFIINNDNTINNGIINCRVNGEHVQIRL
jgi:hypothetical protein